MDQNREFFQEPAPFAENRPFSDDPEMPPKNNMATASLVLGICSLLGICCMGIGGMILGSLAMICGFQSKTGDHLETKAVAGVVTGTLGLVLSIVVLVLLIVAGSTY